MLNPWIRYLVKKLKYLLLEKRKKFFWFDKLKFINIYSFKEYIKN